MLVPVPLVLGMPVTLVGVVHVIAVRDGDVPAALAVRVLVTFMSAVTGGDTFVGMVFVRPVQVTVVHVVDVILVRDSGVAAARAVCVVVVGVGVVISCGGHHITLHVRWCRVRRRASSTALAHCDSIGWRTADAGIAVAVARIRGCPQAQEANGFTVVSADRRDQGAGRPAVLRLTGPGGHAGGGIHAVHGAAGGWHILP